MTTSVEATVHLRLVDALAATPAGIIAVALAVFLLVKRPNTIRVPWPIVYGALALMWAFQLFRFGYL
jgi:hypothetical protein